MGNCWLNFAHDFTIKGKLTDHEYYADEYDKHETNYHPKFIQLTECPFISVSNIVSLNNTEFIVHRSKGLYKYNIDTNKWSLHTKYPKRITLSHPILCINTNKTELCLSEEFNNKYKNSTRTLFKYSWETTDDSSASSTADTTFRVVIVDLIHCNCNIYNMDKELQPVSICCIDNRYHFFTETSHYVWSTSPETN
eukprot:152351_1